MAFKGRIMLAALACMAMIATPSIAAPPAHVFSVAAKSGELRPATVVASVATADAAQVATNDRAGDERAPIEPGLFSATMIVGFDAGTARDAFAPIDPGRRA